MNDAQYTAFRTSAENFIKQFSKVRDKKIAIYGIGQYTAALLPELENFHVIGLMDGDVSNIGKVVYGYRILSLEEAERTADMIIINTSAFYWEMIFNRIENVRIPVYYANGSRAYKKKVSYAISKKYNISSDQMKRLIDQADIVSFDLYDTLVMRRVYNPKDIFKIVQIRMKSDTGEEIPFCELRNKAEACLTGSEYTIDSIYQSMEEYIGKDKCEKLKALEIDTESSVTVARKDMVDLYDYAVRNRKEVYILSDMYLTKKVIKNIIRGCGIEIDDEHLWISCELGKSKRNGTMWQVFSKRISDKRTIHFGDSVLGDEKQPKSVGVEAVHIPSAVELLKNCVLVKVEPCINSIHSSLTMGILLSELFNSPFAFEKVNEVIEIKSCRVFGKCIFGNIVLTYLLNIISEIKKQQIENLLFLARDGYLLKQSFVLLCNEMGVYIPHSYLYVSRKAVLCAASDYEEAYMRLLKSDYNGTFKTYLKERFDVRTDEDDVHIQDKCNMPNDYQVVKNWMVPYEIRIQQNLEIYRKNYKKYLDRFDWEKKTAIVDICYTGSIQYWLSVITGKKITGFYFVADLSDDNELNRFNQMISCFQEDLKAERSQIWKNHKIVESLYTAPYGMVKGVDAFGNPEACLPGNNQRHFLEREDINEGINEFISEYVGIIRRFGIKLWDVNLDPKFADTLFGAFFDGDIAYGDVIKECFWHEDSFINSSKEYRLF